MLNLKKVVPSIAAIGMLFTVSAAEDISIDITEYVLRKSGLKTVALLGGKSGETRAK